MSTTMDELSTAGGIIVVTAPDGTIYLVTVKFIL